MESILFIVGIGALILLLFGLAMLLFARRRHPGSVPRGMLPIGLAGVSNVLGPLLPRILPDSTTTETLHIALGVTSIILATIGILGLRRYRRETAGRR